MERTAVKQEGPAGAPGSRQPRRWVLVVGGVALAGVGLVIALGGWSRDARRLSPEQPVAASRDVIDHLAEARAAERRGDLVAGIAAYEAAQHVAPRAENLYRIGELEEQRGNAQAAAHAFARYLEASPGAADRDIVLTRIARLTPSPTSDAGVPIVRRRTTQPTKQRCRCQPTDGQHWRAKGVNLGEVHVCPTKASSIQCRCNTGLVGPGGTNLCVGGLVECADCDHGARTCKDPRCEPNGWGCAEVDYRSFHLPGRTGDTCRGFEIQAKPVETDGVLECRVCPAAKHPRNAEYLGEAGERCRGWDREHEIERVGVLDQCAAD